MPSRKPSQRRRKRCHACHELLPSENLSYSRQCFLSQRPYRVGLVPQSSPFNRSLQSPRLFSRPQRLGENLASHSALWHVQQIFQNASRTAVNVDIYFSQYPTQSTANSGLSSPLSINLCRFIYASLYIWAERISHAVYEIF